MKIWERRLMKDFHVAPVEQETEETPQVNENPLDKFRRISKQVAAQSASAKWGEVIRSVAPEANTQIGRCRNRESFKNQQNLLKAMEQARKLIERGPIPQSRSHSPIELVDETSKTLVQLLQNISEEINELSPQNTLNVKHGSRHGSVNSPLQSLNSQLRAVLSKNPSPRPGASPNLGCKTPRGATSTKSPPSENVMFPPKTPVTPKPCQTPSSPSPTCSKSFDGKLTSHPSGIVSPPLIPLKSASTTPSPPGVQSPPPAIRVTGTSTEKCMMRKSQSIDSLAEKPAQSPKLIDFSDDCKDKEKSQDDGNQTPLKQGPGSPVRVVKRKAPIPGAGQNSSEIAVSRPVAPKPQPGQGMIPPPPEITPKVSIIPATPLLPQKNASEDKTAKPKEAEPASLPKIKVPEIEIPKQIETPQIVQPTTTINDDAVTSDSKEQLIISKDPGLDANKAASSPPCLRPTNKIEDVKTIKRQPKSGWL